MTESSPIVAVLGPTLSYELTVVGQITPFYNVLQVSSAGGSESDSKYKSPKFKPQPGYTHLSFEEIDYDMSTIIFPFR